MKMYGETPECVRPGGGAHQMLGERWLHSMGVGRDKPVAAPRNAQASVRA